MFSLFSPFLYPSPSLHSLRDRSKRCFENWAGISMELATKNGNRSIDRRDTPSRRRGVIRLFSSFECIERKGNTSPGCSKEAAPRFTACSTPSRLPCNFIFAASPPISSGFAPSLDTIEQNLQRRKFRFSSEKLNFHVRNILKLACHFSFSFSFQCREIEIT